ncbi:MAG: hypothetical protein EA378_11795 [Phycisphaerales bacterium]|nr:MAG: hypothetical protein EA378_11795 [Phycisphaerales bacterium]
MSAGLGPFASVGVEHTGVVRLATPDSTRGLTLGELRIEIDESCEADEPTPPALARWEAMRQERPRLFNGPILAFVRYDAGERTVHARRDHYLSLAVRPEVETGVTQLSVTGILTARDATGREHVCLARRSAETRIYDRMWELAPSGGLDPLSASISRMNGEDAWRQLLVEVEEELELSIAPDPGRVVAITHDALANSCDVCLRVELARPLEDVMATTGRLGWEYETTRWLAIDDVRAFDAQDAARIIPPTRALFRVLGWA